MTPRHRRVDRVFAILFAAFVAAYAWIAHGAGVHDITDSALYRHIAAEPLGLAVLIQSQRPLLYPLLIRLCGNHGHLVVAMQIVLYFAAWGVFAWTLYRPLRDAGLSTRAGVLAGVIFYLGLYPDFAGWNHLIMTESLSLSGLVLTVALLARCVLYRGGRDLLLAALVCCLNGLVRDFNAYISLFMLLPVAVLALRRVVRPAPAALAAVVLLASYGFMGWSTDHVVLGPMQGRWVYPMLNDIGQRVLPDARATRFFVRHGMPMSDTLRSMTGKLSYEGKYEWQFYRDPALQGFRDWLVAHAKPVYLRYLATHPGYALRRVWLDRDDVFQAFGYRLDPYPDTRYGADLPAGQRQVYLTDIPPRAPLLLAYGVGSLGSLALVVAGWRRRHAAMLDGGLLAGALFVLLLPLALVVDHADTMETARHSVSLPAQAVLVALLVGFFWLRPRSATMG